MAAETGAADAPAERSSTDNEASGRQSAPGRCVLGGVPNVGFGMVDGSVELTPCGHLPEDQREAAFRRMVVESICDRGRPLIAHGVIGPPEEAIIAGYDEGGATVMGWSFFQGDAIGQAGMELLPNGHFSRRHWVSATSSLVALGDKTGDPPRRGTYLEALQWALPVSREPVRYGERHSGLAALQ